MVTAIKVSYLVTESEVVALLCINLFKKLSKDNSRNKIPEVPDNPMHPNYALPDVYKWVHHVNIDIHSHVFHYKSHDQKQS